MTLKQQKITSAFLIAIVVVGGFQALIYILNLNEPVIFLYVAFAIYFYLLFKISLLYDLHFKNPGALARAKKRHEGLSHWLHRDLRAVGAAFWDRIRHFRKWEHLRHWQNYLVLPGLIFWSTVCLLYLNLGRVYVEQVFAFMSSAALIVAYWYLKEVFHRRKEVVDNDVFVALSAVKIYTAFVLYASALGVARRFCLDWHLFVLAIFGLTFLLIYQALFQHQLINLKNLGLTLALSLVISLISYFVFFYWGLNYFTAGIFLMAWYNFFWNIFHRKLDNNLTWRYFVEILLLTCLISAMIFSVTNFKARLSNGC